MHTQPCQWWWVLCLATSTADLPRYIAALSIQLQEVGGCWCNHPCTWVSTTLRCAAAPHLSAAAFECATNLGSTRGSICQVRSCTNSRCRQRWQLPTNLGGSPAHPSTSPVSTIFSAQPVAGSFTGVQSLFMVVPCHRPAHDRVVTPLPAQLPRSFSSRWRNYKLPCPQRSACTRCMRPRLWGAWSRRCRRSRSCSEPLR